MKKSVIIPLFGLQVLILVGIVTTAYFTFMNKARIRATQQVLIDTQDKLSSTFEFMDKLSESKEKQAELEKPLTPGVEAPTFALLDENKQEVMVADYKGKKTLLVFSQESCGYCTKFLPILNEFKKERQDVNIAVMQLNSTPDQNIAYKKENGIHLSFLAATETELQNYKVKYTPTSILLDEEGKVIDSRSVSTLEDLIQFVEQTIATVGHNDVPNKG